MHYTTILLYSDFKYVFILYLLHHKPSSLSRRNYGDLSRDNIEHKAPNEYPYI